jgi:hypothetical protein
VLVQNKNIKEVERRRRIGFFKLFAVFPDHPDEVDKPVSPPVRKKAG